MIYMLIISLEIEKSHTECACTLSIVASSETTNIMHSFCVHNDKSKSFNIKNLQMSVRLNSLLKLICTLNVSILLILQLPRIDCNVNISFCSFFLQIAAEKMLVAMSTLRLNTQREEKNHVEFC